MADALPRARNLATVLLAVMVATLAAAPAARAADARKPVGVWAYYYIWFNVSSWNRAKLDYPLLGRYSSDEPSIMREHIRLAKQAGIDGFIVSWKSTPTLDRRLRTLVTVAQQEHFRLAVIYQGLDFERRPLPIQRVTFDLSRFERHFAASPVFHAFGKPLVIWSGTWEFSLRELEAVTTEHRDALRLLASERNPDDYVAKAGAFEGNAYYWSSVNPQTYPRYVSKLKTMARVVHARGGLWIAPAAPGFDARLIGRRVVVQRRDGATLRRELDAAQQADPDAIGLISWNEFSENTHVEPSRNFSTKALEVLADVEGTKFKVEGDLDSSSPEGGGGGIGPLAAALAFIVAGLLFIVVLGRRRRTDATA
jgi:hypothetical protein